MWRARSASAGRRNVTGRCATFPGRTVAKTAAKPYLLTRLGMHSERKQIPQVVENIENHNTPEERWEARRWPKAGALPGCATPRHRITLILPPFPTASLIPL